MNRKRLILISGIISSILFLCVCLIFFCQTMRNYSLRKAAERLSTALFDGSTGRIDHKQRKIFFNADKSELFRSLKLGGEVTFSFPFKFYELPWKPVLKQVSLDGAAWEIDLQKKTVNGIAYDSFAAAVREKIVLFSNKNSEIFPDIMTFGSLVLINPAGEIRSMTLKSILKRDGAVSLLGVHAGDIKVNFLSKTEEKKIIGQYQTPRSYMEFFRLSAGLPDIFELTGVDVVSGQFQYDTDARKMDYLRGSCRFGSESSIRGSIFNIYGSRNGKINWEFINEGNWQLEFINAVSGKPLRSKLHYLILSQNALEQDALSFDGEIELGANSFKEMFGLELDRRTANIRHRVVGKWDMAQKIWELSRLDIKERMPQVKIKWNGMDIAFQGQSFKLSGSGAETDHFGFHYELDMLNADLRDNDGNVIIAAQAKLEGDCILSMVDEVFAPVLSGRISCAVADGAYENTRFLLKDIHVNFSPDANKDSKYKLSVGNLALGIPDLKDGFRLEIPALEGEKSSEKTFFRADSMHLKYKDIVDVKSIGKWSMDKSAASSALELKVPGLKGRAAGESFNAGELSCRFGKLISVWNCDYALNNIKWGGKKLLLDSLSGSVEGEKGKHGLAFNKILCRADHWKYDGGILQGSSPETVLDMFFTEKNKLREWHLKSGQLSCRYKGKEYLLPDLAVRETDQGTYRDGVIKCDGNPCRFDIAYTTGQTPYSFSLKSGRIENHGEKIWGLAGDVELFSNGKLFSADVRYAEMQKSDIIWENGSLFLEGGLADGVELVAFDGITASDMTGVRFTGRNKHGENEFEVKNFHAKYLEKIMRLPEGTFSGMFDGKIVMQKGVFFDLFKLQTFYLKNNTVSRLRLGILDEYAIKEKNIEDEFASDALKDFFAKSLVLEYKNVGNKKDLSLNALGKSSELLPYEFDVKEKKLKKSDVALFNSEVEIAMKYVIKNP